MTEKAHGAEVKRSVKKFGKELGVFLSDRVETPSQAEGMAWCLIFAAIECLRHRFKDNKAAVRDAVVRAINHMLE